MLHPDSCQRPLQPEHVCLSSTTMCGCTLYDSPTCGHTWMSMSQPCGFLSDLLSCPRRETYQTLVAPAMSCPMCNGGFADRETIEMVQGPWGCNQMLRSQIGGSYAIPGAWGNAPLVSRSLGNSVMFPINGYTHDHRLTGPYAPRPAITGYGMFDNGVMVGNGRLDEYGCGYDCGYDCERGRRHGKHKSCSKYKYYHSTKPATNCAVM
jgi:hypothetical protein